MFFKTKKVIDKIYMGCGDDYKVILVAMSKRQKPLKLFANLGNYLNIAKMLMKYIQGIWLNI